MVETPTTPSPASRARERANFPSNDSMATGPAVAVDARLVLWPTIMIPGPAGSPDRAARNVLWMQTIICEKGCEQDCEQGSEQGCEKRREKGCEKGCEKDVGEAR